MSEPTFIPAGAGEVIGDAPDRRVEILSDHDALHATWSRFGPGRDGADLHIHRAHTDLFFVLEGELTVKLGGGEEQAVASGTLVRVPPLVVHGFRNAAEAELRYLNLHAPGQGFADYMRGLRDGQRIDFDQEDAPADGMLPGTNAAIGDVVVEAEQGPSRLRLLADTDELAVCEVTSASGGDGPPLHVHDQHAESFYVLEGALTLTVDGRDLGAPAGSWTQVPAGLPHTFTIAPSTRFLSLHSPNRGFGDVVRALRDGVDPRDAPQRSGFDERPAG